MEGSPRSNHARKLKHRRNVQRKRVRLRRKFTREHREGVFGKVKNALYAPLPFVGKSHDLVLPEKLNLITDYEVSVAFFAEVRRVLSDKRIRSVNLDHRQQKEIAPEAALLLIAELFRSHERDPKKSKKCTCPTDPVVCWVLHEVGYFNYFPGLKYQVATQRRGYLRHHHGRRTNGKTVKALIEHFEKRVTFEPLGRQTLYNALIESMNNVAEHAYVRRRGNRFDYGEWWLLGYFDDDAHEISFSFYDQGLGIPKTIRARLRHQLRSGAALIREAVEHGISRTKLNTRGRGLPSLKKFVDAAVEGTLVISSLESQCVFHKGKTPLEQTWNIALPGTLITWNIRVGVKEEQL